VSDDAFGLLLVGGAAAIGPDLQWFTSVFSQKLDQMLRQNVLAEGDRKQGRERTLLYNIINAVSDPILLTDTEGRLLIANARALTLFTASEEESEGRRGAVRMNNMLLSSALSSKAIEETGATRRELLLVNPADGSDLVFELLSTVRGSAPGSGVVSFCATSPPRRASGDRRELPQMRIAEVLRESDHQPDHRLGGPTRSSTDAGAGTSLMNARPSGCSDSGRASAIERAGAGQTTRLSRHRAAYWSARPAPQRRSA
jgi:PAS domain-containing protein